MIIFENRASTILYNLLCSNKSNGIYILPANICPIVPLVFEKAKQPYEFCDISLTSLCLDENLILNKITNRIYSGILFVRTYGTTDDFDHFLKKIKLLSPQITIIDDQCPNIPEFLPKSTSADIIL
ncbi:MAG: hypothetical protein WCP97_03475, partial [bacterium]